MIECSEFQKTSLKQTSHFNRLSADEATAGAAKSAIIILKSAAVQVLSLIFRSAPNLRDYWTRMSIFARAVRRGAPPRVVFYQI
jgi:hypothetical protein